MMTMATVVSTIAPASTPGIGHFATINSSGPSPRRRRKVPATALPTRLPAPPHRTQRMMAASTEVWCDAVAVGAASSDDHAAVLLALPALDPAGTGVLAAETGETALGVSAGQVGEATTGGSAVALSGVVGHGIGGGKVATALLLLLLVLGGALLGPEGTATTTTLWGVSRGAGHCTGDEQREETEDQFHLLPHSVIALTLFYTHNFQLI